MQSFNCYFCQIEKGIVHYNVILCVIFLDILNYLGLKAFIRLDGITQIKCILYIQAKSKPKLSLNTSLKPLIEDIIMYD